MPTLGEIAERFELQLRGDATQEVSGVCTLQPGVAGQLSFALDRKYRQAVVDSAAAAVIVPPALADEVSGNVLVAEQPLLAFARVAALFAPDDRPDAGIDPTASIHPSARLGDQVRVGAHCVIGARARIGANSALGAGCVVGRDAQIGAAADIAPNVVIADRVRIGDRALILAGAVIGSRGFGNVRDAGRWEAIPQLGSVVIGDDVEIGANTTIDRGALGDTLIADNVRIDNLCQIAHNVRIGERTALASGVGVAGSAVIGRDCMLGGQVGVNGHIEIADGVIVSGGSKVLQSITQPGQYASGTPVLPAMAWRRLMAVLTRLEPRLKKLERSKGQ